MYITTKQRELAKVKKRLMSVQKARQPVWFEYFDQVMAQKMFDELAIETGIEKHQLDTYTKKYYKQLIADSPKSEV